MLRSLQFARLLGAEARCLQAPVPNFVPVRRETHSYSELLSLMGHLDPAVLVGYLAAWRELFTSLSADLVIADHAPTALLAAHSLNLPACAIGTGFVLPLVVVLSAGAKCITSYLWANIELNGL